MNGLKKLIVCFVSNIALLHGMQITTETKEEFINRTQKLPCSKKYTHNYFYHFIEPRETGIAYYAACPNNTSHVLLRPAEDVERKAQLVVLTNQSNVYARQFLGYKKFLAIALAVQRDLFATIHETPEREILKIRRIDTKKTVQKIAIPTYFEIASTFNANPALAFNKQGTDIIVWGADVRYGQSYKGTTYGAPALDYLIFNIEEEMNAQKVRK